MLTQEIIDAIRTAPETVEWNAENEWNNYAERMPCASINSAIYYQWRVKPKPYECRHVVYLDGIPFDNNYYSFQNIILGKVQWCTNKYKDFNKKFEIIVREIIE